MSETNLLIEQLKKQALSFNKQFSEAKIGTVLEVADGVARLSGLSQVGSGEMVEFEHGEIGLVLNLEDTTVGAIILGDDTQIKEGQTVKQLGKILSIGVGEDLIGRVVNPLGQPVDGMGPIKQKNTTPLKKLLPVSSLAKVSINLYKPVSKLLMPWFR